MSTARESLNFHPENFKDFQTPAVRFQSHLAAVPQSAANSMQNFQGQIYPIPQQPKPEIGKDMVKPPYSYIALIAMAINRYVK